MHPPHNPKSAHTQISLHAVGLWQATVGVISGHEAVLQVNHCVADFVVTIQEIIVIDGDFQVFVLGQETRHLKHPEQNKERFRSEEVHWIYPLRIIWSIFSTAYHLPIHAFTFQTQDWWCWASNGLCHQSNSFLVISLCMDHTEQKREHKVKQKVLTGPIFVKICCLYCW